MRSAPKISKPKQANTERHPVTIRLDADVVVDIDAIAEEEHRTRTNVCELLIAEALRARQHQPETASAAG